MSTPAEKSRGALEHDLRTEHPSWSSRRVRRAADREEQRRRHRRCSYCSNPLDADGICPLRYTTHAGELHDGPRGEP